MICTILQKDFPGMYTLYMIVGSSGQGMVLPQENRARSTTEREDHSIRRSAVAHHTASEAEIRAAAGTKVTQRIVTNWLLQRQFRGRRPIVCIPLTPTHCSLRCQ
ncbi:HTH_Tnp_Tc3_2 domain-containing protein [Trichonephila clavipes]|nr:HTH_Tnp_Tc3_2 domain-containing protein [Trichonephila clavipes]